MLGRNRRTAVTLALTLLALAGCRTGSGRPAAPSGVAPTSPPLRVGVTPSSPPFAFRQGGELVGLEVDFARALAGALGRPLQLREVDWDDQIPTLLAGRTDVIMSGMTITPARQVRMAFSDPYLSSGLLAVVRRGDRDRYPDGKTVLRKVGAIGVVGGTTGERFVREHARNASVSVYPTPAAAVMELQQHRVDAVIHDAPVLLWFVSGHEAELAPVLDPLNREELGWGLRPSDDELRAAMNGALARWREDGTRERILSRWIPYLSRLEAEVRAR